MNRKLFYSLMLFLVIVIGLVYHETLISGLTNLIFDIQRLQNEFQRNLSHKLAAMRQGETDFALAFSLIAISWLYGFLHAAGPGHGKAIITTWAMTQRENYQQILLLSSIGALLQACSALLWVAITIGLAQWLIRDSINQSIWLNRLSYMIIIAIGIYIMLRSAMAMRNRPHSHCHCHHHHQTQPINEKAQQKKARLLAMLAIGMRPCSGALIILSVAASWQLWTIGILMTFAMALGTAVTVGVIGLLVTFSRKQIAERLVSNRLTRYQNIFNVVAIGFGLGLCVLGAILLFTDPPITSL